MTKFSIIKYITAMLLVTVGMTSFYATAQALFLGGIPVYYIDDILAPEISATVTAIVQTCAVPAEVISEEKPAGSLLARAADALTLGTPGIAKDAADTTAISAAKGLCIAAEKELDAVRLPLMDPLLVQIVQDGRNQVIGTEQKLEAIQQEIDTHHSLAQSVFWKAIFTKVLLTVSKTLVTRMVSKLNNVYKINDFRQYADSLGALAYQAQRINDVTDSNVQKAMIQSMITDNSFVSQIHPAAQALAYSNLAFDPGAVRLDDPEFSSKLFRLGLAGNNALDIDSAMRQASLNVVTGSRGDALNEINQSAYKSPRTCDQAKITEQRQLDSNYSKKNKENDELYRAYLKAASDNAKNPTKVSSEDVADLWNAYVVSLNTLNDLPRKVDNPVLTACGAIISPAQFISGRIGTMLDNFAKNISDPKTDNLPVALSTVADIASNFASKLILGIGEGGSSSKSNVIDESRSLANGSADGINYQTEGLTDTTDEPESKINFDYTRGQQDGEITLTWDATERNNAESVKLEGPGIPLGTNDPKLTALSGSFTTTITEDATFTLTVYVSASAKNPQPKIKTLQVPLQDTGGVNTRGDEPGGGATTNSDQQAVLGVVTYQGPINPRGPILPRN